MLLRPRLVGFAEQMLAGVPRSDQRAKGELYLRGLLSDGARKSMQPMAQRLRVDHQGLQQFVTSSTWDHELVRANVARWAVQAIDPAVYVVDDSGFPKDGTASPCVARQYSGTLGKTGNCQIGVSIQMATDRASLAANWRLFCPASWDDTTIADEQAAQAVQQRRARGFEYVLEVDPTAGAYRMTPSRSPRRTRGGGVHPHPATRASRPACASWPWRPGGARCARSPGGTARRRTPATRARARVGERPGNCGGHTGGAVPSREPPVTSMH